MINSILFDLDGTLLDTARDFAFSINLLLQEQKKALLNFDDFRKEVHGESKKMICFAFQMDESHAEFEIIRDKFLEIYHQHCTHKTIFFPGMELLLNHLDEQNILWGVVTNKPTWLMKPIAKHFGLDKRAAVIVTGDTLLKIKPDPEPLIHACKKMGVLPKNTVYIGDSHTDILAAKAAGMKSIAVTYGYHPPETHFEKWEADFIAHKPEDIIQIVNMWSH